MKIVRITLICFLFYQCLYSQIKSEIKIDATLNPDKNTITISQKINIKNTSDTSLNFIYLNDWSHAYSGVETPLSKRFTDEFKRKFYLKSKDKLGFTKDLTISNSDKILLWNRLENQSDIVKLNLEESLSPNDSIVLDLKYTVKIPEDNFTGYGYTSQNEFILRYWYIVPSLFAENKWITDSHYALDDMSLNKISYTINWTYPGNYTLIGSLNEKETITDNSTQSKHSLFQGKSQTDLQYHFYLKNKFKSFKVQNQTIATDVFHNELDSLIPQKSIDKIISFIEGETTTKNTPEKIIASKSIYNRNPYYGTNLLSQVTQFVSQLTKIKFVEESLGNELLNELIFFKIYSLNYLNEIIPVNKRKDAWIIEGLQIYLTIKYLDTYYPNQKIVDKLPIIGGLGSKSFQKFIAFLLPNELLDMEFKEQFLFLNEFALRGNINQEASLAKDKLIKFNEDSVNPSYVGVGFSYLEQYIGEEKLKLAINNFISKKEFKTANDLNESIQEATDKDVSWFFDDYLGSRIPVDYKISKVSYSKDSIFAKIKNKPKKSIPYQVALVKGDSVLKSIWVEPKENKSSTIRLKNENADYLAINPYQTIPEINRKNNWYYIKKKRKMKPFRFPVLGDKESELHNDVFWSPIINFKNIYEGLSVGMRMHNIGFKPKLNIIDVSPTYGFGTNSLIGGGSFSKLKYFYNKKLYLISYGLGVRSSYFDTNSRYNSLNLNYRFFFRPENIRLNQGSFLSFDFVNISRSYGDNVIRQDEEVDYAIFNVRYRFLNEHIVRYMDFDADLQVGSSFGKLNITADRRILFNDSRLLSLRLYAGSFLWKNTDSDFFDYSINRPKDYLFRYRYYGYSEKTGIESQEFVLNEGGFKSDFENPYVSNFLITSNVSYSLWKWLEVYGDFGYIKNFNGNGLFVHDSGIRFNFLPDYFELFFPIHSSASNQSWEFLKPNYHEKIRFTIIIDQRLFQLFQRKLF